MLRRWPWEQCSYHHSVEEEKEDPLLVRKKLWDIPEYHRTAISQPEINLPETTLPAKHSINLRIMEKKKPT